MKKNYFELLKKYKIQDTLSEISELSYSKKYGIILHLIKIFDTSTINEALYRYYQQYIKINRVNLTYIQNVLKHFCIDIITKKEKK